MSKRMRVSHWFQYLYFLRFSLIAWSFLPVLCLLDYLKLTATITRGILTMDSNWQAFYAAFFVLALNMSVLVTARNTVRNGQSRFCSAAPMGLYNALTDPAPRVVWRVFAIAHIPTLLTLVYLGLVAGHESQLFGYFAQDGNPNSVGEIVGAHSWYIVLFFLMGIAIGVLFWYLVSLFYYWSYRPTAGVRRQPAALIFPQYEWLFGDIEMAVPPQRLASLIERTTRLFLRKVTCPGFAATVQGPLWELHFLSGLALSGMFLVYLALYPLTAPVPRSGWAIAGQVVTCLATTAAFLVLIADTNYESILPGARSRWAPSVKWTFVLLGLGLAGLFLSSLLFDYATGSVRLAWAFPTLGSILVLAGFSVWLFSGAAFFLDRYRLPVLATVLALIFIPKIFEPRVSEFLMRHRSPWLAQTLDSDHYFSVIPIHGPLDLGREVLTPKQVMELRAPDPKVPYIIVTASGGGIQAAEWTSQVLANLEKAFANDQQLKARTKPYTFHDHLLLASGVSGGSVGILPFLLEYTAFDKDKQVAVPGFPDADKDLYDRVTRPAACSSLEAVGWGLAYHDLYRLVTPIRLPSSLADDTSPDRSWALAAAFNRNLHDEHCETDQRVEADSAKSRFAGLPSIQDGNSFTLRDSAVRLVQGSIPAFTFNTTAAETGSRFLLSDYYVPQPSKPDDSNPYDPELFSDFTPAESFLETYAALPQDAGNGEKPLQYSDLPLATAARLSATFPIVSSGTRIPPAYAPHAYHFLDGGYFDNDGTASVVEFLKSAFDDLAANEIRHNLLLIEIRDDDGTVVTEDSDDFAHQNSVNKAGKPVAPRWTPLSQLTGIVGGLWNAGHVSIARRNRRDLCIFEKTYQAEGVDIHHVVFTIPLGYDRLSPLSWNLTTGQRSSITDRIGTEETKRTIREAIAWVNAALSAPDAGTKSSEEDTCKVRVEPAS